MLSARARRALHHGLVALLLALVAACAPPPPAPRAAPPAPSSNTIATDGNSATLLPAAVDAGRIPVTPADPTWGDPTAPVTLVVFSDFQCPFCAKLAATLAELQGRYGRSQLRIAFKHLPLPFHDHAEEAAVLGAAIHRVAGDAAFWTYHDALFETGARDASMDARIEGAIAAAQRVAPLPEANLRAVLSGPAGEKVAADMELAKQLSVVGTPGSFVNGIFIGGSQPIAAFAELVDAELAAVHAAGLAPSSAYAARVEANAARGIERPKPTPKAEQAEVDPTTWRVPIDGAPIQGSPDALVTLVVFSDFECPFCARVVPTLEELRRRYGDKLRIAFRHQPLPFHTRATPAALLAIDIFKQKGSDAFFKAHDALFAAQRSLDDDTLGRIATEAGLDPKRALAAIAAGTHSRRLEADQALADDLEARGTPHFFVNGRRIAGAQPVARFSDLIDAELIRAEAMVRAGVAPRDVYAKLMEGAKAANEPRRIAPPAVTDAMPSRGPKNAPVVVQLFSDFECPFCRRHNDTIAALEKEFPGKLRVVFRNLPLSMHPNARAAATAALAARAQKGNAGFWKLHDALFERQAELGSGGIAEAAKAAGLDVAAIERAVAANASTEALAKDEAVANELKFDGTPVTVIGPYVVDGAVPLRQLRRVVERAIADAKPESPAERNRN